ncbi:MAG TPA: hypothetical protein VIM79_27325 [Niastella sp.]
MNFEIYSELKADPYFNQFDFISEGHKGKIPKRILFTPTRWSNVYNLAFGDTKETGEIDDNKISDNGDRNKILATVVKVVEMYTNKFPDRWVYFTGSTEHRTRLYRMAVTIHLKELSDMFEICSEIKGRVGWVKFQKGLDINAFLVKKKIY